MGWPSSFRHMRQFLRARGDIFADLKQNARHGRQWDAMVDCDVLERAHGHGGTYRVARILDDRYTATAFDFVEPGAAVVEPPGQDDADHARSISLGRAAKQWVDGGPGPVHARAARERHVASAYRKMMVGRRDVNVAGTDQLAVS